MDTGIVILFVRPDRLGTDTRTVGHTATTVRFDIGPIAGTFTFVVNHRGIKTGIFVDERILRIVNPVFGIVVRLQVLFVEVGLGQIQERIGSDDLSVDDFDVLVFVHQFLRRHESATVSVLETYAHHNPRLGTAGATSFPDRLFIPRVRTVVGIGTSVLLIGGRTERPLTGSDLSGCRIDIERGRVLTFGVQFEIVGTKRVQRLLRLLPTSSHRADR